LHPNPLGMEALPLLSMSVLTPLKICSHLNVFNEIMVSILVLFFASKIMDNWRFMQTHEITDTIPLQNSHAQEICRTYVHYKEDVQ
jgi:hypothetical protein